MEHAQDADVAKVAEQERRLVFEAFDETTAWELGTRMRRRAEASGWAVAIDIRRGDDCLFFTAMPGTTPANADWARRKRNLVNMLQQSSYGIELAAPERGDVVAAMALDPRDHVAAGGCFPIRVAGIGVVGTVTVSGLPSRDDHRLVVDTIAGMLGIDLGDAAL